MNNDEREIVDLMTSWQEKITSITVDYNVAIGKLDEVRKKYENRWYRTAWVQSLISLVVISLILVMLNNVINWCKIDISPPFDITILKEGECINEQP
ncbi:MAG: hypothetical protein HYV41_03835 [Candidatus Magasanikbacteria bacterium]|nr:hypothetical protein [Candidatus Magasanikbacteria bacterium]